MLQAPTTSEAPLGDPVFQDAYREVHERLIDLETEHQLSRTAYLNSNKDELLRPEAERAEANNELYKEIANHAQNEYIVALDSAIGTLRDKWASKGLTEELNPAAVIHSTMHDTPEHLQELINEFDASRKDAIERYKEQVNPSSITWYVDSHF